MAENTFLAGLMVCALCTVLPNRVTPASESCYGAACRRGTVLACVRLLLIHIGDAAVGAPGWRYRCPAKLLAGFYSAVMIRCVMCYCVTAHR